VFSAERSRQATASILPFPGRDEVRVLEPIHLSPPHLVGAELTALKDSLASGWMAPAGPMPQAFEEALAGVTGFQHVVAVSSGTAALLLAFRVLDIGPGDEVWVPGFTFIASIAPAVQLGAQPRFFDICPASWTLDPALLARELRRAAAHGRLPDAVVAVDIYGQCAALDVIVPLCGEYGVPVISDSAVRAGLLRLGRPAGRGAGRARRGDPRVDPLAGGGGRRGAVTAAPLCAGVPGQ